MTDVKTTEHAYSHVLPELYGAYATLAVAAVGLFAFDWRLALASLWSCPVGLAILFGARRALQPMMEATRMRGLATSEDIQEALECVREVRATNQEERYLEHIHRDVDAAAASGGPLGDCVRHLRERRPGRAALGPCHHSPRGRRPHPGRLLHVHDALLLPPRRVAHLCAFRPVPHARRRALFCQDGVGAHALLRGGAAGLWRRRVRALRARRRLRPRGLLVREGRRAGARGRLVHGARGRGHRARGAERIRASPRAPASAAASGTRAPGA